jgi:putative aminopeptidase FrvX
MVTGINGDGTLRFGQVGVLDDRILSQSCARWARCRSWVIASGPSTTSAATSATRPRYEPRRLDIGATSRPPPTPGQARRLVSFRTAYETWTTAAFHRQGQSLDDAPLCRPGRILADEYAIETMAVHAQEEVGLRGARGRPRLARPAIALEGTVCDDFPKDADVTPGPLARTPSPHGPQLYRRPALVRLLAATASARASLPIQTPAAGGTDSGDPSDRQGVPTSRGHALRYIHARSAC